MFNTLTVVLPTTDATRLRRIPPRHFHQFDTFDFRLVREYLPEAVERPPVQVKIAVPTTILRLPMVGFTHSFQVTNIELTNLFLDTPFNDVLGETVEKVSTTLRPFCVQSSRTLTTAVITLSNFFGEVVPVLFQPVARIQVGFFRAVGNGGEIADAEIDASGFLTGSVWSFTLVCADDVKLPATFRPVVDGTHLLDILNSRVRSSLIFNQHVLPRFRVLFVIRTFRQANFVVFLSWLNPVTILIVVVAFTIAQRVRTIVGVAFLIPRVKTFSKLLQNSLTGLAMQPLVFWMCFQLVFQLFMIGDFAGFVPDVAGMVVADIVRLRLTGSQTPSENVPEFTDAPPMPVERQSATWSGCRLSLDRCGELPLLSGAPV